MATITKQWCAWDADTGKVSYQFDNTVSTGFPFGKLTALTWTNSSANQQLITITLEPGVTSADIPAGTVTSIPVAAGLKAPISNGQPVVVGGVTFTASANGAVGATSIAVQSQAVGALIPSGSQVEQPLPAVTIPASGQTAPVPAFYGGGNVGSTGSVSVAAAGVPMIQVTTPHGTFVTVPATLNCAGN